MDQYVLIYYAAQIKISHILLIKLYQTNEPKPINFISGYQANIHNPNFVSVFKNLPLWIIKRNIFLLISNKSKSICPIKKFENYIFSFTLLNKILNILFDFQFRGIFNNILWLGLDIVLSMNYIVYIGFRKLFRMLPEN